MTVTGTRGTRGAPSTLPSLICLCLSRRSSGLQLLGLIEPFVYEWTSERRGSVSAEHGLGFMKAHAMHYSQTQNAVSTPAALQSTVWYRSCNSVPYCIEGPRLCILLQAHAMHRSQTQPPVCILYGMHSVQYTYTEYNVIHTVCCILVYCMY